MNFLLPNNCWSALIWLDNMWQITCCMLPNCTKLSARMKISDVRTLTSMLLFVAIQKAYLFCYQSLKFKLCYSTAACTMCDTKMSPHELQTSMTSLQHLSDGLQNSFAANLSCSLPNVGFKSHVWFIIGMNEHNRLTCLMRQCHRHVTGEYSAHCPS